MIDELNGKVESLTNEKDALLTQAEGDLQAVIAEKDALLEEAEAKFAVAEAEAAALSTELDETKAQLAETVEELLKANLNYQNLLDEKNEFQTALETMQDDVAARLALAEEESKINANKRLPVYSNVDYANEQLREYYDQMQKLQDSILTLQIENTLLREKIDEFTN